MAALPLLTCPYVLRGPHPRPQGFSVRTRVTRRSEEFPAADRIETSEVGGCVRARGAARPGRLAYCI